MRKSLIIFGLMASVLGEAHAVSAHQKAAPAQKNTKKTTVSAHSTKKVSAVKTKKMSFKPSNQIASRAPIPSKLRGKQVAAVATATNTATARKVAYRRGAVAAGVATGAAVAGGSYARAALANESLGDLKQQQLKLASAMAVVYDEVTGQSLYEKSPQAVVPIASITKLMTAMVLLDRNLSMDEMLTIEDADVDTLKNSSSRMRVGSSLSRRDMLLLALMSSENRAAAALARTYPGGTTAFVAAMNRKAKSLGMNNSHFDDSTGLHTTNVSTAYDLVRMVRSAYQYSLIREFSTTQSYEVTPYGNRPLMFNNSNGLVKSDNWEIGLSKTGYTQEAGRCLVMHAKVAGRPVVIVLLDSQGKQTRLGDANRVKQWMESRQGQQDRVS